MLFSSSSTAFSVKYQRWGRVTPMGGVHSSRRKKVSPLHGKKPGKVGLKYCGNCNPRVNGRQIITDLQLILGDTCNFVPWNETDLDLLLIISGCTVDCATRPDCHAPTIVVAASYINHVLVCKEDFMLTLKGNIDDILC